LVICTYKTKADEFEECVYDESSGQTLLVFLFVNFQVSRHGFVSCWRHGWCDNATAQGADNK
jgi:hypothetical protein